MLAILAIVCLCTACGGVREARLNLTSNGATFEEVNYSLLAPPLDPESMARAYQIKKEADMMEKHSALSTGQEGGWGPANYGLVFNRMSSLRTAKVFRNGGREPVAVFVLDGGGKEYANLPFGWYYVRWEDGREAKAGEKFHVTPLKKVKFEGEEYGWVQYIQ
ncbi:MAG: hypothetical protein WCW77_02795 [Patescibacteria group bacterium]